MAERIGSGIGCFGVGSNLAIAVNDETYLMESPILDDVTFERECFDYGFHDWSGFRTRYPTDMWNIRMSFRCGQLKKAQGDIRQHLREQASKLSVAELLDVINTKLDFRGQN